MIAKHASIIFPEKIGSEHSVTCINICSILKKYFYINFYTHGEFCRFS